MTYTVIDVVIILIAMVAAFVISGKYLKSTEISIAISGVVGILMSTIHGWASEPIKLIIEGLFTNLDLAILFVCASLFVNIYSDTGAMAAMTRKLVKTFNSKWVLLIFMAIFMLIPGAVTGAGSVSVFVVGSLVATVVRFMGLSDKKTAAFVFIFAILSAAAPPINLWAMLMTAQANMPYVGFELLLLGPIFIVGAFTIIFLGWGTKRQPREIILQNIPVTHEKLDSATGWIRILLPLVSLVVLILLALYAPFTTPVFGLPLMFVLSGIVALLCNPNKFSFKHLKTIVTNTSEQVFPLVATVISVGVLQNAMAASGVKGLIGTTFVLLPFVWIYATILIVGPFAQGSMSYGSAVVIGTPLIFMFNTAGMNTMVVCAALSLIFPIGDSLPPSRIVGRITLETVGYKDSYMSFFKQILPSCAVLGGIALLMLIYPNFFSFLV